MKVRRTFLGAVGVMALASATVFGAASSSARPAAKAAAASCKTSIAVEAPFATGPAIPQGLEQLHFAELAVAMDNKSLGIHVTLGQDDTGLSPALATTRTNAIIASGAVAIVGPSGSQEVEAVGPLMAKAGIAGVSGSATLPALTTSGANSTFFRVVPDDNVQGPDDAHYIIKHKLAPAGSTILIVDDEEAYSTGITAVMIPILQAAGYTVNHQSYNGTDTGATLQSDLSSLATSQVTATTHLVILPWQSGGNAEQFGQVIQQQGKTVTLFGTDGTNSPLFVIPGTYVSEFGPDISTSKEPLQQAMVKGVAKYGPYGAFGVPTWAATNVAMRAIASVCKAGKTPSRANVLAAIRKTNIPAAQSGLALPVKFQKNGDLAGGPGYLYHINAKGKYIEIPDK
jgi:branched-chain amino acid transport system substrate-binding protein